MRHRVISLWVLWSILSAVPAHALADSAPGQPEAFLPESVFEFPPVVEGTEVVHEFVLHNRSIATLEILDIKSG